jgi:hypothetical protein
VTGVKALKKGIDFHCNRPWPGVLPLPVAGWLEP